MIASADGRATIEGRSSGLGHPEDRALFRAVRGAADAVLVGSRTLVVERYATLLDDEHRERRAALGLAPHPVVATISRLGPDAVAGVPLLEEPGVPIAIYTEQEAELSDADADVEVVALGEGRVELCAVLADLHARHGVRSVSCEGGPRLLRELAGAGCLDELLVTVAPMLVAGAGPTLLTGDALPGPPRMTLADVHRAEDHLFLRYVA